jgi:hypothetical protein
VRWCRVGKVKTQYAETYTFYATTDDGARLWVDNVPLIDRWDSYCNETSATIALKANVFYNMKMEYKQVTGSAFAKLSWASQSTPKEIVPSSQLYYETQAKKSPFSFIVMPNVANGTRSTAAGAGLAVATAGTAAQFTIQANDMYDNERGEGGDVFSVRLYPPGSIEKGTDGRAVHGVVVDNTDSSYSVEYTTYKSGVNTLYAALLVRGGVTATYYDNNDFTVPVKYAEGTTNLQKVQFSSATVSNNDNSVPTVDGFSVRFAGFVAPTKDSVYEFHWARGLAKSENKQDRVRLWVDNSLIIDQWSSLYATAPSGNIELRAAYYYDTKLDYKWVTGCTSGSCLATAKLQWKPSGGSAADITSANLYRGYDVMDSPFNVDVKPAGTCAAKSIAIPNQASAGHSLELSTAGLQSEFTITAKDLYGNLRLQGGDNFKVRLTGVDSTSGLVQDMSSTNPGTYRVVYTSTKSGTYDISIVFGASGINQSPFRMVTQPARRHLGKSIPTGQALTLATAGIQASVTITVKDRHDNWQPDPSVVDADVKFGITDVATHQPTNVVQDSVTPDDVPSFVDKVGYIGPSTNAGYQISTPTDLDNPKLVLRYRVTRSGKYSMALGGSKSNDGPVAGSPFDLTIFPNLACATTSTASGDSLSLATAGVPGTFTIMARDEYFNLRGSNVGDNFVARVRQYYSKGGNNDNAAGMDVVECGRPGADCEAHNTYSWGWTTTGGRDKPATVVDNGDGSYAVSYQATRSTTNYVWAAFAQAGGLQATYYLSDQSFGGSQKFEQVDKTVDFSVTGSTKRAGNTADPTSWSARWTGMVRPSLSETYTFHAGGDMSGTNKNERVKLWVDNSLLIHQWSSLGTGAASAAPSGKIHLTKDTYYEILLAAKASTADTSATAKFQLQWEASHHKKSVISSSRLFVSHHISNSPFKLDVLPAITCAATSRVYRPALTLTTAGVMASFTVQSKDAFDNIRMLAVEDSTAFSFSILANASLPEDDSDANRVQPSENDGGVVAYAATTFYIGNGGYQVNYTATKRGVYNVRGQIMQPGGVFGSYYENDDLTDHGSDTLGLATESKPFTRMDATIDFDWKGGRPVPAPSLTMKKDIGPSYFSARWQGMVRPLYSEVYTFSIAVDDGAKLWINDLLVVDHWYSRCSEVDGTIALMAGTLYPMRLEYKQIVGNASAHLSWSSRSQSKNVVPSTSLYSNTTTYNLCNRNQSLYVEPAVVCAATSTAEGAGLTGATAGRPAKFTIQSRDEYMNNRKLSDAGIRPGSAEYACDDWAHSGTLHSGGAQTLNTVLLDATSASSVDDFYTGRTITFTAGTGAGQARVITDYFGATKTVTLYPPLSVQPDATTKYSLGNYGGQWSEKCDATRTQAFREGFPEFHVRVTPIIEGSQAPYHAAGIVDAALIDTALYAGSGITRLASTEYPGGLTATYYDTAGTDTNAAETYTAGFLTPKFSTKCTTAQACDETIDFSHSGVHKTDAELKLTYGEYPEAIGSLGNTLSAGLAATYYDHPSKGWVEDQRLANSEYAVRWSGFIAPTLAGVYTFHTHFYDDKSGTNSNADLNDRVKLWIDNTLVIQQWTSLITSTAIGTFYFKEAYPSAYPISIHYKNPMTATDTEMPKDEGGLTLRWENLATGSTLTGKIQVTAASDNSGRTDFCGTENGASGNWLGSADANAKEAQPLHVCLAKLNVPSADQDLGSFTTTFGSSHGAVSEKSDEYIAQMIRMNTPGVGEQTEYVRDYVGVVKGTVRAALTGTTSILLATESSTTDDYYNGHYIVITGGKGAGQARLIKDYAGCDKSGCDPMQGDGLVGALWGSTPTTVSGTTKYCDCSGTSRQLATVDPAWTTLPDTTSQYSIHMYRVELNQPIYQTDAATSVKYKTKDTVFSLSTGYNLVTYGQADCAEFTGVAQGGGNTTRVEEDIEDDGTTAANGDAGISVFDAAALFGGLVPATVGGSARVLWAKVNTVENMQVTGISANALTTAVTTTVIDATSTVGPPKMTCSATAPCTMIPRNTLILAADANTEDNYYTDYYIQILSGSCAGQWRKIDMSKYNGYYVTISVQTPWALVGTSEYLGCTQPDSTSVYYLSKVCTENQVTLQTVGPLSALTIRPGFDGEAILQSAQSSLGKSGAAGVWAPGFYGNLNTQGDAYPYPYQPYDHGCCKALSGKDNDDAYNNMLVVITGGTGRGQRRFTTDYAGTTLQLTVYPDWTVLPDSTSRYAIFRAKATPPSTQTTTIGESAEAAGQPKASRSAPVVPSSRLFPLRGRYEVTYTPTVKGDYQVHASLAQGSGLDATYYDDMDLSEPVSSWVEQTINFDVSDTQRGFGNDVPRGFGDLALSDKQSFSVRWAGLLQLFDDRQDGDANVFTFETGIAETDERVKLWIDNSLIIDRWETYDYLSATTFSATIGLRSPYYYDVKMEYKQYAGAAAQAVLRWECGVSGSPCQSKQVIPSSNLFQAKEVSGSPFPPHEVQAAPTSAARSTVRGIPLSLATAGVMDSFTIQSHDEYDNERGSGGDRWVVRAVPYNEWDRREKYGGTQSARTSKDCVGCPRTVYGAVEDMGDSSYVASFNGTKKGAYKVLTSLAVQGGMFATYYKVAASELDESRFHRDGQLGDSESDFPVPCVYRADFRTTDTTGYTDFDATTAAWRGAQAEATGLTSGVWRNTYQCQNWIRGTAQAGFCAENHFYESSSAEFNGCIDVTGQEQAQAASYANGVATIRLKKDGKVIGTGAGYTVGQAAAAGQYGNANALVGMVFWAKGKAEAGFITSFVADQNGDGDYDDNDDVTVTVSGLSVAPGGTDNYHIFDCGVKSTATTEAACTTDSETLAPQLWVPTPLKTIILDVKSSEINDAYKNWDVKIVKGRCQGQVRKIVGYVGKTRLATVGLPWATTDGTITDAYGRTSDVFGCTSPDATSEYILYNQLYAPGSMDEGAATFGVRWAGFVRPSATSEYTFRALLSGTDGTPNAERVKLWIDNSLIIDEWTSISSTAPSGTISFPSAADSLYDVQMEYKRLGGDTTILATAMTDANDPAGHQPPFVSLQWKNEQSGSDATLSEAYDYKVISSARLFTDYPVPNSRVLDLLVADTCATVSVVSGNGLTTATAGVEASFTITAKDSFANDRELEEDSFVVTVTGPSEFQLNAFPEPSPSVPGNYHVSYTATESGSYTISVQRANAGGLRGEYFNNMWLLGDAAVSSVDEEIDFSWGAGAVSPPEMSGSVVTGSDYMSVRWSGLFKPELSELYTFYAAVDNGARLYVNDKLVVDQWEVSAAAEYNATLDATAGLLYDLKVEYRHTTGDAGAVLSYASPSVAKRVIPSSRLFNSPQHVFGSPFTSYVSPAPTCGTTSFSTGAGLCGATAGHYAAFTIQARDEYQNTRTKWEDTFVVKASQTDHLGRAKTGTVGANVVKGRYNVAYLVTKAGSMGVFASLAVAGGITATYYDSVSATYYSSPTQLSHAEYSLPAKSRVDTNIHANNYFATTGGGSCSCTLPGASSGTAAGGTCGCLATCLVQDQVFAVRWSGFIRPSTAAEYTFRTIAVSPANEQERVKLWLDNQLVIDQWTSLSATAPSAKFSFPVSMDYYELEMEYRSEVADKTDLSTYNDNNADSPTARLVACNYAVHGADCATYLKAVPSSYLAQSADVLSSPFMVTVKPDVTDFAVSKMAGVALSIATAGVESQFVLQAKDTWGNTITAGGDQYLVHIASVGGSVLEGVVEDNGDGTYGVSYTPSVQGTYDVNVYLGSSSKTSTLLVEPGSICATTSVTNGLSLTVATAGFAATFTIQAKDAFKNVRTLGDNNFVMRVSGPGGEVHNNPAGYIGVSPNTNLGRYTIAYKSTQSGAFSVDVKMASGNGLHGVYYRDSTFSNAVKTATDSTVDFNWGTDSPDSKVGIVDGFSIEWSGYVKPEFSETYTFLTKVAEADERVKLWVDDQWVVDQWSSLSSTQPTGTLWLVANTLYDIKLQYKDETGSAQVNLLWESTQRTPQVVPSDRLFSTAAAVAGSPFTATVFPALTSGTVSTATGSGLSLATAGSPATFTIQAKDHLGNAKTTADDIFVVRARHNADYSRRNILGTVTALGGNLGQYSVSYTPTWKRNHLSCAGAGSTNTCQHLSTAVDTADYYHFDGLGGEKVGTGATTVYGVTANQVGLKHKFHDVLVSQAVKGGLFATYYTNVNAEDARSGASPAIFPGSNTYRTMVVPTVDKTLATADDGIDAVDASFGIRYSGFFSPPTAATYTFTATVGTTADGANHNERVRLWVDNSLVIDQWLSLRVNAPSGTLQFDTANALYDIKIEYKQEKAGATDAAAIKLEYQYPDISATAVIPSTRLYQAHDLTFKIFDQAGLSATYYNEHPSAEGVVGGCTAVNCRAKAVQESTVDWSGTTATDRPYPESVVNGAFSVRWTGFIKPSRTDQYTFYATLHGSTGTTERVQLWVDNSLVIAQWGSLAAVDPSGTLSFPVAEDYYNLVMDYKVTDTANRGIQLKWENDGQEYARYGGEPVAAGDTVAKGIVRPDSLFQIRTSSTVERDDYAQWDVDYHKDGVAYLENREDPRSGQWAKINGCPTKFQDCSTTTNCDLRRYERCRGQGVRTNEILRVDVKPAVVCAAKSTVADNDGSLSISTAGVTRTFTLTARDAFDNQRDAIDDSFIARATLLDGDSSDPPFHGSFTHQNWATLKASGESNNAVFDQNGKYEVQYYVTRSSSYQMTIQSADVQGNGLYGTYFSTTSLIGTAVTQTDATIDFNWGRSDPTTSTSIKAGAFSVRWSGYVKTNYTEVYTFYTNCDYGVRLYVDKRVVVDKWALAGKEYSGSASLRQGVLYDLTFEYQTVGEVSYCSLSFSSPSTSKQVIPKSALFVEAQTVNGGALNQYTLPSVISASVSTIHGPGLSIATAGIPASFTVLAKDMYGNLRDACADIMYARMVPDAPTCTLGSYPYNWMQSEAGSFLSCSGVGKIFLKSTDPQVMTDQINNNDNHAFIGDYTAFGMTKAVPKNTGTSWSDVSTTCTRDKFTGNKHPFTYIQTRASSHTLYVSEVTGGLGKSYKTAVGKGLMATYYETSEFGTPRNAMDCIKQDGQKYGNAACNTELIDFSEADQGAPASLTDDGVFSVRFTGLIRMPTAYTTFSEVKFHTKLDADSKDERVKLWIDNSLIIDQWSSLSATDPSSTLAANRHTLTQDQFYDIKVEYKNVVGGTTDGSKLQLLWETAGVNSGTQQVVPITALYPSHPISAQSVRVRVNPNVAFARECEVYGQGLTLATAGLQATFAIQSKDAYDNKRGTGGDLFVVRAFSDGCQVYVNNNVDTKQTCQPYGPAIATCGGTDTVCGKLKNPGPAMNDGGDDDGLPWSGVTSVKVGGEFHTTCTSCCVNCPRIVRGDVVDNGDSTYTASFTGTQKGRYTVVTSLVNSGGLLATYYDEHDVAEAAAVYNFGEKTPKYTQVDTTVDWSALDGSAKPTGLTNEAFAVRWVGFVRPSRASQYTFHVNLGTAAAASAKDRVKLWVDNSIVVQQWTSLSSTAPSGTMGFAKGNGYYDISMLYKCPATDTQCGYSLLWENTASGVASDDTSKGRIPSTRLFQRYDVPNTGLTCSGTPCINKDTSGSSKHTTLQIMPSVTCASQSKANGDQLSLRTAGVAASFTIQAKDAYENTREDTSASFTVDLFGSGGSPIYNGGVSGATASSGTYIASYTAENAKVYDMFVKYGSENIKGSPFTTTIKPSNTCGTKSTIQGTGLTAASISPSKSAFTIQARDQYGNAKTQALVAGQDFVVRVVRTSGTGMQGTRGTPPYYERSAISTSPTVHGTFNTATNDGKYAGYYQVPSTPSPTGYTHYLYASWIAAGGVSATYYDFGSNAQPTTDGADTTYSAPIDVLAEDSVATTKRHTTLGAKVIKSDTANGDADAHGVKKLLGTDNSYSIRFNGMYKTTTTQRYFKWNGILKESDRVRLWVDNKLIVDQWTSLDLAAPTGSYLFDSATGIYDVHAEIFSKKTRAAASTVSIQDGNVEGTYADVAATRLYFTETLSGSPYAVTVST